MNLKKRVLVLYGGQSAEHEVSLQSAVNVIDALDKEKYDIIPLAITREGKWQSSAESLKLLPENTQKQLASPASASSTASLVNTILPAQPSHVGEAIDVVFPVLHGPHGEDGSVQGLMELTGLPYVGSGILGSALAMDKDVAKRLLRAGGLPVVNYITLKQNQSLTWPEVTQQLGDVVFVKPANMGSSVGVSKVTSENQFRLAITEAFTYDSKAIIESQVIGRELECAVLGNDQPQASVVGEIVLHSDFYSYDSKYINDSDASLQIPADLPESMVRQIQELSIKAFSCLECRGMARVDFFLAEDGSIYINEINTIPGFTAISMYPKLWQASGIGYSELIDVLINLAFEEHAQKSSRK